MTVVASGYDLKENELYQTPHEFGAIIFRHLPPVAGLKVWECAAGEHKIADLALMLGARVHTTDIATYTRAHSALGDFLKDGPHIIHDADMVVTNPPYGAQNRTAAKFCRRALSLCDGWIAMLLTAKFDSGSTRYDLFGDCPRFHSKIVLTDRISWEGNGKTGTEDHCWLIWRPVNAPVEPPRLIYARARLTTI